MPKFIAVIKKTEEYYVRINAPSRDAADMWENEVGWEDFIECRDPDFQDIDMDRAVDPEATIKRKVKGGYTRVKAGYPGNTNKTWFRKRAHVTVDEEGEETI